MSDILSDFEKDLAALRPASADPSALIDAAYEAGRWDALATGPRTGLRLAASILLAGGLLGVGGLGGFLAGQTPQKNLAQTRANPAQNAENRAPTHVEEALAEAPVPEAVGDPGDLLPPGWLARLLGYPGETTFLPAESLVSLPAPPPPTAMALRQAVLTGEGLDRFLPPSDAGGPGSREADAPRPPTAGSHLRGIDRPMF